MLLRFWIAFLLSAAAHASAQTYVINTFAGGAPLPTPVAASQSSIGYSTGPALDAAGNLYVASDNCVFKIAPNGVMTRIAGNARPGYSGDGGPATNAQLNRPQGIALDAGGNLYIADNANDRVRKVTPDGTITTLAGTGTAGYSGDGAAAAIHRRSGRCSATEKVYQLNTFDQIGLNELPATPAFQDFAVAMALGEPARQSIKGHNLDYYLNILHEMREKSLAEFRKRDDQWLMTVTRRFPGADPTYPFARPNLWDRPSPFVACLKARRS